MTARIFDFDAIVIGAGVVGLAIARALALSGRETLIVEAANAIGSGTSSRNSEVVHSGLYYAPDSLKARLCTAGNRRLYEFCAKRGVAHHRCGKLIVAVDSSELAAVEELFNRGVENGLEDLELLSARETHTLEPELHCSAALLSPSTGILDSHALMLALLAEAEEHGAVIALQTPFLRAEQKRGGFLAVIGGAEPAAVTTSILVNSAGLSASKVAELIHIDSLWRAPQTSYAKGNYFALSGRSPFRRLVYPAPQTHGLGIHLTIDLAGQARLVLTSNGSMQSTTLSIRAGSPRLKAQYVGTGRVCRTLHWRLPTAG